MQACEELKNLVLRHYGKFASGGQSETIQEMYSLQDGVVIIGAERGDWFADRDSIRTVIKEGSSTQLDVDVHDIEARSEGSVGWTLDRVLVTLPDGSKLPIRHTRIFHQEDGKWKMVHLHISMAAPDESI
jgi:ketosteroid isomerase-like protein